MEGYLYDLGDEIIVRKASGGGIVAHLSNETVNITIGEDTVEAYPIIGASYDDIVKNVVVLIDEEDGYSELCHPVTISDESERYTGYPYYVEFSHSNENIATYAQTATGTLYKIYVEPI